MTTIDIPNLTKEVPVQDAEQAAGHVVIVHRWQDRYAHYTDYVDHAARPVSYVTTAIGRSSVPVEAAEVIELERTDDLDALRDAVSRLAGRHGRPHAIVALKEGDLPAVSTLRQELGCAGRYPDELRRFLDKLVMANEVARAGIAQPAFADAPDADAVIAFAERVGWPVMLKPRRGSASQGIVRLSRPADLGQVDFSGPPRMAQEHVPHPVYHVDGVFDGDRLGPWRASRYVNTCLSFTTGTPLGSIEVDDPVLVDRIGMFTARVAAALSGQPWVFHLELFIDWDGIGEPAIQFLEVGCRVGGAEVPYIWRDVHGIDLMAVEVALQLGRCPAVTPMRGSPIPVGGWLLMPAPRQRPCRVLLSCSLVGQPDGPYAEKVLAAGEVIPAADAYYEHVGGRFRFRGRTSDEVEKAVVAAAVAFDLRCE